MKINYFYFLLLGLIFTSVNAADETNIAKKFDIGHGRHLYLKCKGSGSPTVILEAGHLGSADTWTLSVDKNYSVFSAVASFTRVCAYDRPGTINLKGIGGRSDVVRMPRVTEDMTEDLHAVLHAANVKGPYILVGHSLGGLLARLYASKYPNDVVGLVLVDAFSEKYRSILGPKKWQSFLNLFNFIPKFILNNPAHEHLDINKASDAMEEADARSPLKSMPVIVIARGKAADLSPQYKELTSKELEKTWRISQEKLALAFHTKLIIAEKSGHNIQVEQPKLVVKAIRKMVEEWRSRNNKNS